MLFLKGFNIKDYHGQLFHNATNGFPAVGFEVRAKYEATLEEEDDVNYKQIGVHDIQVVF